MIVTVHRKQKNTRYRTQLKSSHRDVGNRGSACSIQETFLRGNMARQQSQVKVEDKACCCFTSVPYPSENPSRRENLHLWHFDDGKRRALNKDFCFFFLPLLYDNQQSKNALWHYAQEKKKTHKSHRNVESHQHLYIFSSLSDSMYWVQIIRCKK